MRSFLWVWMGTIMPANRVALSKKKKTTAEALNNAEILYRNGAIDAQTYNRMRQDILNGKIRDEKYYLRENKQWKNGLF